MIAYHYCNRPFNLESDFRFEQREMFFKPCGLWLCKNNEWFEWSLLENFRLEHLKYKATVDIDMSDILIIDNLDKLHMFQKDFVSAPDYPYSATFPNWTLFSKSYKGIWIDNYYELKFAKNNLRDSLFEYQWLMAWDVPSGCVCNMSAIKAINFEKVPELKQITGGLDSSQLPTCQDAIQIHSSDTVIIG